MPPDERGGIITGWLVKVTLGLAVGGVVLFDALSIGAAAFSVQDAAQAAARDAVDAVELSGDTRSAFPAALTSATGTNAQNVVDPDDVTVLGDGSVAVTVHRTAPTLVVERVRWISGWAERSAGATAAPTP